MCQGSSQRIGGFGGDGQEPVFLRAGEQPVLKAFVVGHGPIYNDRKMDSRKVGIPSEEKHGARTRFGERYLCSYGFMRRYFAVCLATLLFWPLGTGGAPTLMPRVASDWWGVANDPDLGEYTSPKQQPVDFCVWQAADGT